MADVKHTPGPWSFSRNEYGDRQINAAPQEGRLSITLMSDPNYYPWCPGEDADWLLIAAAPELLDALIAAQTVLRYLPDMTTNWGGERETMSTRQAEARVIAAIAKATGAARATEGSAT